MLRLGQEYFVNYIEIVEYLNENKIIFDIDITFGYTFIVFEDGQDMVTFKMEYL